MIAKARSSSKVTGKLGAASLGNPDTCVAFENGEAGENVSRPLDEEPPVSASLLFRNLLLFTLLKTIGSFDSGAFSVALGAENGIAEEWGLSTVQQGTLTSSVFLGNLIGCPLSGNLFSRYSAKTVLAWSLIFHILFTFLFATLTEYTVALLCRFFIGVTLSFIIVYTPIWVDDFAPRDRQSVWMASHNAGVPLGIMIGYSLGAFLPTYMNVNWEWAFYLKCILTVPIVANLIRVDRRSIDRQIGPRRKQEDITVLDTSEQNSTSHRILVVLRANLLYIWRTCIPFFYNVEYMCSTLAMCSLYFVVTGLQNFVTQYLRDEPFQASMKTIMLGFGAAVVTAPVFGVITGGILLDRIGGYHRNLFRVTLFTCAWGSAAAFFSIVCIFITETTGFLIVISIVLFCGGAIIPPGSGTVMSSVPERLRPAGAALSQMMFNLLGNFSGPMVCGFVADLTGDLRYGIYTVLSCSVVGLVPMFVLLYKAYRLERHGACDGVAIADPVAADVGTAGLPRLETEDLPVDREGSLPLRLSAAGAPGAASFGSYSNLSANLTQALNAVEDESIREAMANSMDWRSLTGETGSFAVAQSPVPTTPLTSVQMPPAGNPHPLDIKEDEDMDEMLAIETEAAQMMSFPNQHNFGLDMLRSLLNSSRRSRASTVHSDSAVSVDTSSKAQLRVNDLELTSDLDNNHEIHSTDGK